MATENAASSSIKPISGSASTQIQDFLQAVIALDGKRVACFCKPLPCHLDVINQWFEAGCPSKQTTHTYRMRKEMIMEYVEQVDLPGELVDYDEQQALISQLFVPKMIPLEVIKGVMSTGLLTFEQLLARYEAS
jgi:hypothetical protein